MARPTLLRRDFYFSSILVLHYRQSCFAAHLPSTSAVARTPVKTNVRGGVVPPDTSRQPLEGALSMNDDRDEED